jgi:hypothetical protein
MEIRTSSVSFPPLRGGGPRSAEATIVFPRVVVRAAAALTNYAVSFSGSDHHLGNLQIALDPVVNGDAVTVTVTYGLRDWSGNWDDDYSGDFEFAVIAELVSPTAPPPRTDLIIADAEFNQAIQFFESLRHLDAEHAMPDNSIRLVGGKNLGVRLYVDYDAAGTTAPIATLSGEMRITTSSGATTTLAPLSTIVPRPQASIDRGNVGHTLNFMIPGIWCEGQLDFSVEAFDAANPTPRSASFARTLRFIDATPLEVHAVAIHYTGQSLDLPAPSMSDVLGALDFTERVYPVGQTMLGGYQAQDYSRDLKPSDDGQDTPGYDGILDMLEDLRGGGNELFVALLPQGGINVEIDSTGWSIDGIERNGVGVSFIGDGPAVAHEIAHAFGREHAPCDDSGRCDDPDSPDENYPHYGMYPSDSIGEFGFDPIANSVMDPAVTSDFMGYSSADWVSPYTYSALIGALPATGGGPQSSATSRNILRRRSDAKRRGMGLMLRLTLAPDGTMRLEPSFTYEVQRVPLHGCGKYTVEQRNEKGEVLQCVTLKIREPCRRCHTLRIRQLVSRSDDATTLAILCEGNEVLVEPFGDPPPLEAHLHTVDDHLEINWTSEEGVWVLVQGLDLHGVWRGLIPRTQQRHISLPRADLAKRRYNRLRILAVLKLATASIDLNYDPPAVVSNAEIITRVVAPGVLKAWVVGHDGSEPAQVRWFDEFGAEIGRGHTLDLRHRSSLNLLRVSAVGGQRLIPTRVITLDRASGSFRIAADVVAGTWRNDPVAPHPGKPDHHH